MFLSPLADPGLTLACHRIAALCVMLLQADFGVEIAGTMWIVLSVFFKDQNNNGICSAHSLTVIDHLCPPPHPPFSFSAAADHISCVSNLF